MNRPVPAPVRAARDLLAAIKDDTDPQEWAALQRRLPALAMRLAAAGATVDEDTLRAAISAKDAFNAAADSDQALSLAAVARLFRPTPDSERESQQKAALAALQAAVTAQDIDTVGAGIAHLRQQYQHDSSIVSRAIWSGLFAIPADVKVKPGFIMQMRQLQLFPRSISYSFVTGQKWERFSIHPDMRKGILALAEPVTLGDGEIPAVMDINELLRLAVHSWDSDFLREALAYYSTKLNDLPLIMVREEAIKIGNCAALEILTAAARKGLAEDRTFREHMRASQVLERAIDSDHAEIVDYVLRDWPDAQGSEEYVAELATKRGAIKTAKMMAARGFEARNIEQVLCGLADRGRANARVLATLDWLQERGKIGRDHLMRALGMLANHEQTPVLQRLRDMLAAYPHEKPPAEKMLSWQIEQLEAESAKGNEVIAVFLRDSIFGRDPYSHDDMARKMHMMKALSGGIREKYFYEMSPHAMHPGSGGSLMHFVREATAHRDPQMIKNGVMALLPYLKRIKALTGNPHVPVSMAMLDFYRALPEIVLPAVMRCHSDRALADDVVATLRDIGVKGIDIAHFFIRQRRWIPLAGLVDDGIVTAEDMAHLRHVGYPGVVDKNLAQARLWRRAYPGGVVEEDMLALSPRAFRPTVYELLKSALQEAGVGALSMPINVYRLQALFRSEDRFARYIRRWGDRQHDFGKAVATVSKGIAEIKFNDETDMKAWGDAVLRFGPEMMALAAHAHLVPKPGATLNETRMLIAAHKYKGGTDHPALAGLCFQYNVSQYGFDRAVELIAAQKAQPDSMQKSLPDITLDGATFGLPGARFRRLAPDDPRGLFLGKIVDCCQHIDRGHTQWCAEHGFLSPHGAFYVLEAKDGAIIGMSWAWRGTRGEMVFDSLEKLGQRVSNEQWDRIVDVFAAVLADEHPDITALLSGTDGQNIAKLNKPIAEHPALPRDHKGYSDSKRQYSIWVRPGFDPRPAPPQGPAPG